MHSACCYNLIYHFQRLIWLSGKSWHSRTEHQAPHNRDFWGDQRFVTLNKLITDQEPIIQGSNISTACMSACITCWYTVYTCLLFTVLCPILTEIFFCYFALFVCLFREKNKHHVSLASMCFGNFFVAFAFWASVTVWRTIKLSWIIS